MAIATAMPIPQAVRVRGNLTSMRRPSLTSNHQESKGRMVHLHDDARDRFLQEEENNLPRDEVGYLANIVLILGGHVVRDLIDQFLRLAFKLAPDTACCRLAGG